MPKVLIENWVLASFLKNTYSKFFKYSQECRIHGRVNSIGVSLCDSIGGISLLIAAPCGCSMWLLFLRLKIILNLNQVKPNPFYSAQDL